MNHVDITDAKELEKWVVPMTKARREFGKVVARVQKSGQTVVVTKGGKPVAKVGPVEKELAKKTENKRFKKGTFGALLQFAGSWKGTYLDDDKFWEEILTKDSKPVVKL